MIDCGICGLKTGDAAWAKLGAHEAKAWMCLGCYSRLWNVLDQNE